MLSYIQVVTTVGKKEQARAIAQKVLNKRLAACVQITTCSSMYRWKGRVETDEELLVVMKSRRDLFKALEKVLKKNHPYEVPEILATPVVKGNKEYLAWLDKELLPDKTEVCRSD